MATNGHRPTNRPVARVRIGTLIKVEFSLEIVMETKNRSNMRQRKPRTRIHVLPLILRKDNEEEEYKRVVELLASLLASHFRRKASEAQ